MPPPPSTPSATLNTKGHELGVVARCLCAPSVPVVTVDVGTKKPA